MWPPLGDAAGFEIRFLIFALNPLWIQAKTNSKTENLLSKYKADSLFREIKHAFSVVYYLVAMNTKVH